MRKIKDKDIIHIDRDTYRALLQVYKKHSLIPGYEKIKITNNGGEKKKDDMAKDC